MGNTPSECHGETCYQCNTRLPAVGDWNQIRQEWLEGGQTFVFLGGVYYRRKGSSLYQCANCFWRPKREREQAERRHREEQERRRQEEARRRQEEERRRQEEARRQEEERKRQEEARRKEEERRRQEEARRKEEERRRQEEARRQEEERKRQEEARRKEEERRRQEEARRKEEERRRQEEARRQEEERKRQEEARRKEEERRRQEEAAKASEDIEGKVDDFVQQDKEKRIHKEVESHKSEEEKSLNIGEDSQHEADQLDDGDGDESELPLVAEDITIPEGTTLNKDDVFRILINMATAVDPPEWRLNIQQTSDVYNALYDLLFDDWVNEKDALPNVKLLGLVQTFLFELYFQGEFGSAGESLLLKEYLYDCLSDISKAASSKVEKLCLTQSLYELVSKQGMLLTSELSSQCEQHWGVTIQNNQKCAMLFIEQLLCIENQNKTLTKQSTKPLWARKACSYLVNSCMSNSEGLDFKTLLNHMLVSGICEPVDLICILHCISDRFSSKDTDLAKVFEIMLAYRISPSTVIKDNLTVLDMLFDHSLETLLVLLFEHIKEESDKSVDDVLKELQPQSDSINLEKIGDIARECIRNIKSYGFPNELCIQRQNASTDEWCSWAQTGKAVVEFAESDMVNVLSTLCCAVKKNMSYWPRPTQIISCIVLLIQKNNTGRMVEIATGEGKSCINAMFAAMQALHKQTVDIVTSSPILADRDAELWTKFYETFNLTTSSNVNKPDDSDKRQAYSSDVVYGTVACYAADILKQEFQLKVIRGERQNHVVLVDEVDFMLLDRGVQCTYLSHDAPGLCHLEHVLAMVWNTVSKYIPLRTNNDEIYYAGPSRPFYECIASVIDLDKCNIDSSEQLIMIAEEQGLLEKGITDRVRNSSADELKDILSSIESNTIVQCIQILDQYIPYSIQPWILNDSGAIEGIGDQENAINVLVTGRGQCCILTDDFSDLKNSISDFIRSQVKSEEHTDDSKIYIPKNLTSFVQNRVPEWVENAFNALNMTENRDYVLQDGQCIPVDYQSTGMVELSKRWGGGLQQFLEMKHRQKISQITIITNFMSNIKFFKRYNSVYGVSGTLGTNADQEFLQKHFDVDFVKIPCHKVRKLYEEPGVILKDEKEWTNAISEKVQKEVNMNSLTKRRRSALVICEDIQTATELSETLKKFTSHNIILYARSDNNQSINEKMKPGDIIVATNLAGRGTDIPVSDEVNRSGGLFVLVTFLPKNRRIELQAFGRTGRKGRPGSAQIIVHQHQLKSSMRGIFDMDQLKVRRNASDSKRLKIMDNTEVRECLLREDLFAQYCTRQREFYKQVCKEYSDDDDRKIAVSSLHEHWGMWLQMKSKDIQNQQAKSLSVDLDNIILQATHLAINKKSPSSNIYHIIKYGNERMFAGEYKKASRFYDKAIALSTKYSAIAYYNRAHCIIKLAGDRYMDKAKDDLKTSMKSLQNYKDELFLTKTFVETSLTVNKQDTEEGDFASNVETVSQIYNFFEDKIEESIKKLDEIKNKGEDAIAESTAIFSLIPNASSATYHELFELWQLGLMSIFSVKQKPRFCWEALVVFFLGVAQVIAGAVLTVVSVGSLTSVGIGLIAEGVSDMYEGIKGMVTGTFSWASWAISKAISIAVSIIGAGIGKLLTTGYKAAKMGLKVAWKELKTIPKLLKGEITKHGMSEALKKGLKESGKQVGKEIVTTGVMEAVSYGQEKMIDSIMNSIRDQIKTDIEQDMVHQCTSGQLGKEIDQMLCIFHEKHLHQDTFHFASTSIKKTVKRLTDETVEPFLCSDDWSTKVLSAMDGIMQKVKEKLKASGKSTAIFTMIESCLIVADVSAGLKTISELQIEFDDHLQTKIRELCDKETRSEDIDIAEYDNKIQELKTQIDQLKREVGELLAEILSDAITNILKGKVTKRLVDKARQKVNTFVNKQIDEQFLHQSKTEEKLRAQAGARFTAHGPTVSSAGDINKKHMIEKYVSQLESDSAGSLCDARIIADSLGIKVEIYKETTNKELKPVMTVGSSSSEEETVRLIYREPSESSPNGHYDVVVDGKIVSIKNKDKSCLFRAIAKGHKPDNDEETYANDLRKLAIKELSTNSDKWGYVVEKRQWLENVKYGNEIFYEGEGKRNIAISAANEKQFVKKSIKKADTYNNLKNQKRKNPPPIATDIDHEPPYSVVRDCKNMNSNLAKALSSKIAGDSPSARGPNLTCLEVPTAHHKDYLTTGRSKAATETRKQILNAVKNDDPVDMLKKTLLASSLTFVYEQKNATVGTSKLDQSIVDPNRRKLYDGVGFQSVVDDLYNSNGPSSSTTKAISQKQYNDLTSWINKGGFKDPNDPTFKALLKDTT